MLSKDVLARKVYDFNSGRDATLGIILDTPNLLLLLETGQKFKRIQPQQNDPDIINFWMRSIKEHGIDSSIARQCPCSVLMDVLQTGNVDPPNHSKPWTEGSDSELKYHYDHLLKYSQLNTMTFKEWLKTISGYLGRKEGAVLARMDKLGFYLKRFTQAPAGFRMLDEVGKYFKECESQDVVPFLIENLQCKWEIEQSKELARRLRVPAPSDCVQFGIQMEEAAKRLEKFRKGFGFVPASVQGEFIIPAEYKPAQVIERFVRADIAFTQAFLKKVEEEKLQRRQALTTERASLKRLQKLMSSHSVRFPGSSVESFGLQYSKLLTRMSELDKLINN